MSTNTRRTPLKANWKCFAVCFCMTLANLQYGFDAGVIANFQAMPGFLQVFGYRDPKLKTGWGITTTNQQLITSFLNVGTMIGVLFTAPFGRFFGRRAGIWAGSFIAYVGASVQIGSTNIAGVCVGRALVGASNAFFITYANSYIAECSPPHIRALISSIFGIMTGVGAIISAIICNSVKTIMSKHCYQIPLACLFFFPTLMSVVCLFLPESPRWLLLKNRSQEAERSLTFLRDGSLSPDLLQEEFIEIARGIEEEKAVSSRSHFLDIFKNTDLRRTIICTSVVLSRASSGLWLFLAYGTYFYQQSGIGDPFVIGIYVILAMIVGTLCGMFCSYKWLGRRTMMLMGTAGAGVFMLGIAIADTIVPGSIASAKTFTGLSICYQFIYGGFSGAMSWPISAEVVSSRLRVHTLSFATGVDYLFAWMTAFCSPYFINPAALGWGARYCWIWAGSNVITYVFFYFMLPEMKGRSLEEIDELFEQKISARKFAQYHTHTREVAHDIAMHKNDLKVTHVESSEEKTVAP